MGAGRRTRKILRTSEGQSLRREKGFVAPPSACWTLVGALAKRMMKISYAGYRFPPEVMIARSGFISGLPQLWRRRGFAGRARDRGLLRNRAPLGDHFGPMIAAQLRKRRLKPHATWHLDEVYLKIDGRMAYLWRAVDAEGEVLDVLVQSKRNKHAALKLMRKLLRKYAFVPERLVKRFSQASL